MIQKYGPVIKEERLRQGMSLDVLANILLLDNTTMEAVESGQAQLSDFRLNICANIFHLSKDALSVGVRQVAISDLELRQSLDDIKEQISALKINVNKSVEKTFGEQIDEVLAGTYPRYDALKIGDTPKILLDIGCEQLPILYTQSHLRKALLPKDSKNNSHGLDVIELKGIYEKLEKPVFLFDSLTRKDSIVILTDLLDKERCPVLVTLKPNGLGSYQAEVQPANFATSIYGKNNISNYLDNMFRQENLLFYDKEKSQKLFSVLGLEFPKGLNNFDSDVIVRQSEHIVKDNVPVEKREESVEINEEMAKPKI